MNFQEFTGILRSGLARSLPGEKAQILMAPAARAEMLKNTIVPESARKAAVLMLFFPKDGIPHMIFIQRQKYDGVHSGQIAFPGGKMEAGDQNLTETAIRETSEEIGIEREKIEILGKTSKLFIPPSRFLVQPVVGITEEIDEFVLQEDEVMSVITIPVKELLNEGCRVERNVSASYMEEITVPCFSINGNIIWGATAMILSELIEIIRQPDLL